MAFLRTKIDGLKILIGSNIGSMNLFHVLVWNLANVSLISWSFTKIFLLKISLISTYKMPPHLLSNLLKVLSNLSPKIRNIGSSSPYWLPGRHIFCIQMRLWHHFHLICIQKQTQSSMSARMENWWKFEYFHLNYSALLSDNKPNKVASFSPW